MNSRIKRKLAAVLTALLMIAALTSCAGGTGSNTDSITGSDVNSLSEIASGGTVSDGIPWYDTTRLLLEEPIDQSDYDYVRKSFVGLISDKLVYFYHCQGCRTAGADTGNMDYVVIYDLQGELSFFINVNDAITNSSAYPNLYVNTIKKAGDNVSLILVSFDEATGTNTTFNAILDVSSGQIGQMLPYTNEFIDTFGSRPYLSVYNIGDYEVHPISVWENDQIKEYIAIIDCSDNMTVIDYEEAFPTLMAEGEVFFETAIDMGDGKALVELSCTSGKRYFELNCTDGSISETSNDFTWLERYIPEIKSVAGYGSVIINEDGIQRLNFETSSLEEIFNYSNSNINRFIARNLIPVEISDDRVILCGTLEQDTFYSMYSENIVYVLQKADTNPNQGKSIIRLASLSGYSYPLCDAVCRFNDTSTDYFITYDLRYDPSGYTDISNTTGNRLTLDLLSSGISCELGNQLTVDLMAGDGPDIIIGGSDYSQINNANCLVDLTDYVQTELTSADYYTNVFDVYREGGAIYQIPVTFGVAGIATSSNNAQPGQVGFTYDQYAGFVSGPCNGENPIAGGKLTFFLTSVNCMEDLMYGNGTVNYDNEAFRELAQYTAANVLDPAVEVEAEYYNVEHVLDAPAECLIITNIASYHRSVADCGRVLLGFPTYDARGPIIVGNDSIGICAQSGCIDGCMEFLSVIMGEESQECFASYGMNSGIPVNRQAFAATTAQYIESFNDRYYNFVDSGYGEEGGLRSVFSGPADEALGTQFETVINSLSGNGYTVDAPVNAIIREEIPAYFEGQKTLDEVIVILNDRVQTVLNERG